jgi:hypothetical protein
MRFSALLATIVFAGCAATGPEFEDLRTPSSEEAIIYLYRPHNYLIRNSYPCAFIDGEKKDPLKDGGYLMYSVAPGITTVTLKSCDFGFIWTSQSLTLSSMTQASTRYYYRLSANVGGTSTTFLLDAVSKETAISELQEMRLSE